ncbi:hypothetical protein AVEN_97375-1 [Araneus ventricosus]|uniref:Uncharacterized protein n=1 Tax=Araneus ventricosus TaxID=182803 RepID=A0A4Y2JDL9_ARAVE|nr:hypothetical protein AVEN_97375-1 [Araneus ventricosus]
MALSLTISKDFTSLTEINVAVVILARYFTMPRSVPSQFLGIWKPSPNLEQEWLKRVANNLVSRQKILRIVTFITEIRDLFRPP